MTLDCWQPASPRPGGHGNHSYSSPTKGGFFGLLSNNRMQNARSKRSRGKVVPLEIAALSRGTYKVARSFLILMFVNVYLHVLHIDPPSSWISGGSAYLKEV